MMSTTQLTLADVDPLRDETRCIEATKTGNRCANDAVIGMSRCHQHIRTGGADEPVDAPVWKRHRLGDQS